jgi:uncharacterized membrane protein YkgB
MNRLTSLLSRIGVLKNDLDYHLIRSSMVMIFAFFGYQKWFEYEAQALIPYISLLLLGFWNKRPGILGALGSCFSFVATMTVIPFIPDGWAASAGGFPAMTERVAFLMGFGSVRCLVLFAEAGFSKGIIQPCVFTVVRQGKQMRGGKSYVLDSEFRPQVEGVVSRTALPGKALG